MMLANLSQNPQSANPDKVFLTNFQYGMRRVSSRAKKFI